MGDVRTTTSARTFGRDVDRIAALLPDPTAGSHIAMAFENDRDAFLATLFAIWAKGHAAALPRDARRNSVSAVLARPEVALLAHDTGVGMGLDTRRLLAEGPPRGADGPALPWTPGAVTTHTHWPAKQVAAVLAETVARLALPRDATVWNAFTPGSPCALIPGLLAPLQAGCRITGAPSADPAVVANAVAAAAAHTLVAPAALLRRLARGTTGLGRCVQAIAPDGPLDPTTVARFAAHGIAARGLVSMVPHTDERHLEPLLSATLALADVDDAAAIAIDVPGPVRTCCAIATPRSAADVRAAVGLDATIDLRCVPSLARDRDGQLDRGALLRLFGRLDDGRPARRELRIEAMPAANGEHRFSTPVPTDYFGFAGHFPTYPVLSGAVQLHELVLPCLRRVLGPTAEVAAFLDLKFLARIAPGDTVRITLRLAAVPDKGEFEIARDAVKCSSGRFVLRPPQEIAP